MEISQSVNKVLSFDKNYRHRASLDDVHFPTYVATVKKNNVWRQDVPLYLHRHVNQSSGIHVLQK